jgi:2,3-bisphosphoglycerate-dependent phosphoglycerate mutase
MPPWNGLSAREEITPARNLRLNRGRMNAPISDSTPSSHAQVRYQVPDGSTVFILVRHGSSESYVEGEPFPLVHGHGDPALSPLGVEQAELLAPRLRREAVDAVYVTPLRRTKETVAPYLSQTGLTASEVFDLREVFLGEWEGGDSRSKFASGHPLAVQAIETGEWGFIPGAESTKQLQDRCVRALMELHQRHRNQRIVCVVHGGVISAIAQWATGTPSSYHWGAENASVHNLIVNDDYRRLHLFNDTAHLD